jgi:hypothetical protein
MSKKTVVCTRVSTLMFFIPGLLFAESSGWLELDLYECTNFVTATFCQNDCKKAHSAVTIRVKADPKTNKVLVQSVFGELTAPENTFHSGCEVFDTENWDCSTKPPADIVALAETKLETIKMTNGIYTRVPDPSELGKRSPQCAK